ncbi:MAG: hypothetical protein IT287_05905 [Bdellovibrionaceae bacterium]|nr:hypothetical protein [Pseudobdellovibrionaceae bacterium]
MNSSDYKNVVWEPKLDEKGKYQWLRDPTTFVYKGGAILAGSQKWFVEYPSPESHILVAKNGTAYESTLMSPNGRRNLGTAGFGAWSRHFFRTGTGVIMFASLPAAVDGDYNKGTVDPSGRRHLYVFEPALNSKKTAGGFPLIWKMQLKGKNLKAQPFLQDVYSVHTYHDLSTQQTYIMHTARNDHSKKSSACLVSYILDRSSLALSNRQILLCPGRAVSKSYDNTGWDRSRPLPSEERYSDRGGLLEGARFVRRSEGIYYLLYSAGAYEDTYGSYVAVCSSPLGPCQKVMNAQATDSRSLIEYSPDYVRVGAAFPVKYNAAMIDIIFHARLKGTEMDTILRCSNFKIGFLSGFVAGGPACGLSPM